MADLHEPSRVLGSLMITIYVLGYAIGPLFLAPLSEIYGRYPVVIISSWFLVIWLLGCSFAPTMPSLIIMRLLAGIGGSAIITISPAIVGDLYPVERRAFGSAIIAGSQSTGPMSKKPQLESFAIWAEVNCSWSDLWRIHHGIS